jgi:hypothetical protein
LEEIFIRVLSVMKVRRDLMLVLGTSRETSVGLIGREAVESRLANELKLALRVVWDIPVSHHLGDGALVEDVADVEHIVGSMVLLDELDGLAIALAIDVEVADLVFADAKDPLRCDPHCELHISLQIATLVVADPVGLLRRHLGRHLHLRLLGLRLGLRGRTTSREDHDLEGASTTVRIVPGSLHDTVIEFTMILGTSAIRMLLDELDVAFVGLTIHNEIAMSIGTLATDSAIVVDIKMAEDHGRSLTISARVVALPRDLLGAVLVPGVGVVKELVVHGYYKNDQIEFN